MSSEMVIKHFEGKPVAFRQDGKRLLLSMKEIGELLGYKNPAESASKVYQGHKDEFDNDCTELAVSAIPGESRQIRERLFTLEGLALLCMFSEQPIAKKVRKWASKLMKEVWTEGHYQSPALTAHLERTDRNQAVLSQDIGLLVEAVKSQQQQINDMRGQFSRVYVPGEPDISHWPTPAQRARTLILPEIPPKGFNTGGKFDDYATRLLEMAGKSVRQRVRYHLGKRPEFVVPPCSDYDAVIREAYRKHLGVPEQRQLFAGHRVLRIARRKRHGKRG